jgi:hypothetical protein
MHTFDISKTRQICRYLHLNSELPVECDFLGHVKELWARGGQIGRVEVLDAVFPGCEEFY